MKKTPRTLSFPALLLIAALGASPATLAEEAAAKDRTSPELLAELVSEALAVETPTWSAEEFAAAAETYARLEAELAELDREALSPDEQVDRDLLEAHLATRRFEIETLELHRLVPVSYFQLGATDALFLRPCAQGAQGLRRAAEELERLPEVLANGLANLERPAREWTKNALYQAGYARLLLGEELAAYDPAACGDDLELAARLKAAAGPALEAVEGFEAWLREELLPRSTRSPAWKPGEIEHYQFVHEGLAGYGVDEMLRIAEEEEARLLEEMAALATRIHPSGDLRRVWELMKEEASPWPEVLPMARRYVELASNWLRGEGSHLVTIPAVMDYGAVLTPPMARRTLSFGGAYYGPTVAGRLSGYYVITPLENRLAPKERASRLKAYNPYWTSVISYHEWLGHNVQRAHAEASEALAGRPMRRAFRSSYLSQAWSFYLEKLLEDEGFYRTLPYMEELKTRMARRQMRMWRVQRILTKLRMAKGEMSFEEAVEAYVEKIGMERANAYIEVQRDSQYPSPPGREIIGERVILDLRAEAERRLGEHYRMKDFHDQLLSHGELPLPTIGRLMFGH